MNNLQSDIGSASCDGYGCDNRAKSKIVVKIGSERTIFLSLCESCKTKFKDSSTEAITQNSEVVSVD